MQIRLDWMEFNMQSRLGYANKFRGRWAESNMHIRLGRRSLLFKSDLINRLRGVRYVNKVLVDMA